MISQAKSRAEFLLKHGIDLSPADRALIEDAQVDATRPMTDADWMQILVAIRRALREVDSDG